MNIYLLFSAKYSLQVYSVAWLKVRCIQMHRSFARHVDTVSVILLWNSNSFKVEFANLAILGTSFSPKTLLK
jgi:hypothetical protein